MMLAKSISENLFDCGEIRVSGHFHKWMCLECTREFYLICYECTAIEEIPAVCPWCAE